jgi:hypothetical protein
MTNLLNVRHNTLRLAQPDGFGYRLEKTCQRAGRLGSNRSRPRNPAPHWATAMPANLADGDTILPRSAGPADSDRNSRLLQIVEQ